jgi:hypothetical protein
MKRLLANFVFTPAEQRLVIFVMLLLVAGAWFKQHRDLKYSAVSPPMPTMPPLVSPSPNAQ